MDDGRDRAAPRRPGGMELTPPPLRLGALLVLCSLSGLAVPVGSGSTAGELSAAALLLPLLPLLPPPVVLADSHAALHADLKDKTRAQLTRKMDAGEQLAGVKAASFTAAGAGTSEYVYCPGMDVDNARFTANRKAFGLTYAVAGQWWRSRCRPSQPRRRRGQTGGPS